MQPTEVIRGVPIWRGYHDRAAQREVLADVIEVERRAPPFSPMTAWGRPMSVRMTSAGRYGWFSDRRGYRYIDRHPDGGDWPAIPESLLRLWREITGLERLPDCCLVNRYGEGARMGLHQDRDEADFGWPVLSVSLGDDGRFRLGGTRRGGTTESTWLRSGDVCLLAGESRLIHHGIDRVRAGSSDLIPGGGRLNLTMRVVD